jgi:DNA-binding response OmpR family regulator
MGNMLILVVEDEPSIAEVVSLYLRRAGYQVEIASDGWAALNALDRQLPGLIVLDVMLPGLDGFEIIRRVRLRGDIPIIILTARREEADRIAGLEMGADDYVVKPFSPQEMVSRVRAVLRRGQGISQENQERPLTYGDLLIDPQTRLVTVQGTEYC